MTPTTPSSLPYPSFQQPYADAGHHIPSVFGAPTYRCEVCKSYLVDLAEDLVYGEMRVCSDIVKVRAERERNPI